MVNLNKRCEQINIPPPIKTSERGVGITTRLLDKAPRDYGRRHHRDLNIERRSVMNNWFFIQDSKYSKQKNTLCASSLCKEGGDIGLLNHLLSKFYIHVILFVCLKNWLVVSTQQCLNVSTNNSTVVICLSSLGMYIKLSSNVLFFRSLAFVSFKI